MKTCGIYMIKNLVNGKVYIGQSIEIERRWKRHKNDLVNNTHRNEHLIRAWYKYGELNFTHEIIETCKKEDLDDRERYWIKYYRSNDYTYGYNCDDGGRINKKLNNDIKEKIGNSRTYAIGCDNYNSVLTEEQVIDIKYSLIEGEGAILIAKRLNIPSYIVHGIKNLKTYTCEAEELNELLYDMFIKNQQGLSIEDSEEHKIQNKQIKIRNYKEDKINEIMEIKRYLAEGEVKTFAECYKKFNKNKGEITGIAKVKTYKGIGVEYNEILKDRYDKNLLKDIQLSSEEISEIKFALISDTRITNKQLAKKYNIDPSTISNIKLLKVYQNIESDCNEQLKKLYGNFTKREQLSDEEIIGIKRMLLDKENKYTNIELGKIYNIDPSQISRIKNMKTYKNIGSEYNKLIIEKYNIKVDKEVA